MNFITNIANNQVEEFLGHYKATGRRLYFGLPVGNSIFSQDDLVAVHSVGMYEMMPGEYLCDHENYSKYLYQLMHKNRFAERHHLKLDSKAKEHFNERFAILQTKNFRKIGGYLTWIDDRTLNVRTLQGHVYNIPLADVYFLHAEELDKP